MAHFFDTFVSDSASGTKELEDSPVGHVISFMGTKIPAHYLACDGTVYNILEYPILANHISSNFGNANHFGGNGISTFAVPGLVNSLPSVIYCIKYEPTFFVKIVNGLEPIEVDIDKEIMETLESLNNGLGINQIITDTLVLLNSNQAIDIDAETQQEVSNTITLLNSGDEIVIDKDIETAISETIDVLNQ